VIDISGHQFIRKNGGKSLKRLSESQQCSVKTKALNLTHSQPHQLTPGVRLAKYVENEASIQNFLFVEGIFDLVFEFKFLKIRRAKVKGDPFPAHMEEEAVVHVLQSFWRMQKKG